MDVLRLRRVLGPLIEGLKDACTHDTLPKLCADLELEASDCDGSKRDRIAAAFEAVPEASLPAVAERFLEHYPPAPSIRNAIQDLLWADASTPAISKRLRREVARALDAEDLYLDAQRFDILLNSLWVLEDDPFDWLSDNPRSLKAEIERHVHRNPGDWTVEHLFDQIGAFDSSDHRFVLFLEGLASSEVRPDEEAQRRFVEKVNVPLRSDGIELREVDSEDGYPVFRLVARCVGPSGRPKNLIFASATKPDIRIRDAISNDIEIATNVDEVLVYDRPIGPEGLRWCDLQRWWSDTRGIESDEEAKKSLYKRLQDGLPETSPPQRVLFDAFYRGFGKMVPGLPALLPEVWLHWDPKTVKERGPLALLRFRMDFLLLLPFGVRVVVEVDGKHHYAQPGGRADSSRYAAMMTADRELKLAGYEVFRFGAEELQREEGPELAKMFFSELFTRFSVTH